jgi:hypothetical protein
MITMIRELPVPLRLRLPAPFKPRAITASPVIFFPVSRVMAWIQVLLPEIIDRGMADKRLPASVKLPDRLFVVPAPLRAAGIHIRYFSLPDRLHPPEINDVFLCPQAAGRPGLIALFPVLNIQSCTGSPDRTAVCRFCLAFIRLPVKPERHSSAIQRSHLAIFCSIPKYMIDAERICYFNIFTPG